MKKLLYHTNDVLTNMPKQLVLLIGITLAALISWRAWAATSLLS